MCGGRTEILVEGPVARITHLTHFFFIGELPPDELLQDLQRALTPFGEPPQKLSVPKDIREAVNQFVQPSVTALSESGALAILNQAVVSLEQIPKLVDEVGEEGFTLLCLHLFKIS